MEWLLRSVLNKIAAVQTQLNSADKRQRDLQTRVAHCEVMLEVLVAQSGGASQDDMDKINARLRAIRDRLRTIHQEPE